jgi:hypothetical protein
MPNHRSPRTLDCWIAGTKPGGFVVNVLYADRAVLASTQWLMSPLSSMPHPATHRTRKAGIHGKNSTASLELIWLGYVRSFTDKAHQRSFPATLRARSLFPK